MVDNAVKNITKKKNADNSTTTTTKSGGYTQSSTREGPQQRYGTPIAENDMGGGVSSTIFSDVTHPGTMEDASQAAADFYGRQATSGMIPMQQDMTNEPQSQRQPQEEKKKAPLLAKIGVAPAVVTANLISKGLSLISGGKLDLGTQSIEDFASRPIGQVLGYATDVAGLVAGGMALASLIPAGATTAQAATITELASQPATLPNVIKTFLTKNFITIGKYEITGAHILVGGYGTYVGTSAKIQSDAKRAIASTRTSLTLTLEGFKMGAVSYGEASEALDMAESQINSYDRGAKMWGTLSILELLGASKDARVDAENARRDVLITRQQLNQQVVNQVMGK